jgi:hypothetical protein
VFALRGSRALLSVLLSVFVPASPKHFLGDSADKNPIPTQLPGRDALLVGTDWYPEQWPESRWETDLQMMCKHYGEDGGGVGWQIDNEHGYGQMSQDEDSRKQFQEWLKEKYKTLDSLNDHCATAYWSQTYDKTRVHQDDSALLTVRVTGSQCSVLRAFRDDSVALLLDNSRFVQERVRCEL